MSICDADQSKLGRHPFGNVLFECPALFSQKARSPEIFDCGRYIYSASSAEENENFVGDWWISSKTRSSRDLHQFLKWVQMNRP
jgi:hypothetical protein